MKQPNQGMSDQKKIIELMLELLNTIYGVNGHMGKKEYEELAQKMIALYKEVK